MQAVDESSGRTYYFNSAGETTWEKPAGFKPPPGASSAAASGGAAGGKPMKVRQPFGSGPNGGNATAVLLARVADAAGILVAHRRGQGTWV